MVFFFDMLKNTFDGSLFIVRKNQSFVNLIVEKAKLADYLA